VLQHDAAVAWSSFPFIRPMDMIAVTVPPDSLEAAPTMVADLL